VIEKDPELPMVATEGSADFNHSYEVLLESCERLFDNEIEQHVFEDQMRHIFGTKVNPSCKTSGLIAYQYTHSMLIEYLPSTS
jgi:hypothetical protein